MFQYIGITDKSRSISIEVSGHAAITIYPKDANSVVLKFKEDGKLANYFLLYRRGQILIFMQSIYLNVNKKVRLKAI